MPMNPMAAAAVGALVRGGLWWLAAWLVDKKVWTHGEAETYVTAASIAIVAFGWSYWSKRKDKILLNTGLAMAGVSKDDVKAVVKRGAGAPALVPSDRVPYLEGLHPGRYSTDPPGPWNPPEETP
jgi:hypothetical protein